MTEEIYDPWNVNVTIYPETYAHRLGITTGSEGRRRDERGSWLPTVVATVARDTSWPNPESRALRDRVVQRYQGIAHPVSRTAEATLDQEPVRFLFMDCGRWGGSSRYPQNRHFGLVRGRWVLVCEFRPNQSGSVASCDNNGLIDQFLQHLCTGGSSCSIIRRKFCRYGPDEIYENSPLYLFLGDLHLPVANSMPPVGGGVRHERGSVYHGEVLERSVDERYIDNDEPAMGRIVRDIEYQPREHSSYQWYGYHLSGDIFEEAEEDLSQFLTKIENFRHRNRIHLIQVGDMYEVWLGFERYFSEVRERSQVVLRGEQVRGITASQFIEHWVAAVNNTNPVANRLHNLDVQKTWIWGNHDNYLACLHPNIPARQVNFSGNGIFAEHGHQGDEYNRDGAIRGHDITQSVFVGRLPYWRELDPNRRRHFIAFSALRFLAQNDFYIYVMAHTHSPYLTDVNVYIRPGSAPEPSTMMMYHL